MARQVFTLLALLLFRFEVPVPLVTAQGPGGGTGCEPWAIESPSDGSTFDHGSSVATSGSAPDSGINWKCKISQDAPVGGDVTGAVEGTSTGSNCDGSWSGTVSEETGNGWRPVDGTTVTEADATVELIVGGDVEASVTITFENPENA